MSAAATRFRDQAELCLRLAASATAVEAAERWRAVAAEYEESARRAKELRASAQAEPPGTITKA